MNWWQTESTKIPAKYTDGEAAGEFNPADIRGSYTFWDINKNFGIPLEDLQTAFRLPVNGDTATFPVKSLEELYSSLPVEMGTASVRLFTAFYNGLPYDLAADQDTYLFAEAAEILKSKGRPKTEQADFLAGHTLTTDLQIPAVGTPVNLPEESSTENVPESIPTDHVSTEMTVTGKTTIQNLLDWGMTADEVNTLLGGSMPETGMSIKDFAASKGIDFSTLKTNIQIELDKK